MTLLDGTEVREGDKVRAKGEDGRLRICTVLTILKGGGVDKAILTAQVPKHFWKTGAIFGTVIRSRYQIKPYKKNTKGTKHAAHLQ